MFVGSLVFEIIVVLITIFIMIRTAFFSKVFLKVLVALTL